MALIVAAVTFGIRVVGNSASPIWTRLRGHDVVNRALQMDVVDRITDSNLIDRVRTSPILHRLRNVDVDQISIDPEILQQLRDHGSLPTLPSGGATCEGPLILSAEWGRHDGGHSIAITPSDCVRRNGLVMRDQVWEALVSLDSEASGPGMRDQLICHMIGAQDKPTWNLEPWRPAVGLQQTILNLCNP